VQYPVYDKLIVNIKQTVGTHPIYLIIDETTDVKNRYVVNVMVGVLNGEQSKPMLLTTIYVNRTNFKTISQCIIDALTKLWDGQIQYDRLWLLLSDQASYLKKAVKTMRSLFPNLHHVTCLAHALNRVCIVIKDNYEEVNQLVSLFKEVMVKSHLREYQFHEKTGISLPPKPVITRWNTWLNAAFYYSDNFTKIHEFINELPDSSKAIIKLKKLILSKTLENSLLSLKSFNFMTIAITRLQSQSMKLSEYMDILNEVKSKLKSQSNQKFIEKLDKSLAKNTDLYRFTSDENSNNFKYLTSFAPLVSCDVERSFSKYKDILSSKRQNMTIETIERLNAICFNSFMS
jgi:hypothetical protein